MALNVLNITFDDNLANPIQNQQLSGAQQRQIDYAQKLNEYVILTPRSSNSVSNHLQLTENLHIFPTASTQKKRYILDAYQLGLKLIDSYRINCLTTANPQKTGLVGYLLKRKRHIPLNIHLMADIVDNPYYLHEHRRNPIYNVFTKWLLKKADSIRVSTQWEYDKLINYPNLPEIWKVPFYIRPEQFLSSESNRWRQELLGEHFDHIVLSVGRLSTQKDPLILIEAAKVVIETLPRTRFVLVGDGPLKGLIQNKVDQLGLSENVLLTGAIPYEQMAEIHHAADVFAISSIYEGTCMVLQEAAVAGKPIVSTKFAGALDMILDGENGLLASIGDSQKFAEHLCYLLTHPLKRVKMGQSAKSRALGMFPKESMVELYYQMWKSTAENVPVVKT